MADREEHRDLDRLHHRLDDIVARLDRMQSTIERLEARPVTQERRDTPPIHFEVDHRSEAPAAPAAPPILPVPPPPPPISVPPTPAAPDLITQAQREFVLGSTWLPRTGAVLLVLGLLFLGALGYQRGIFTLPMIFAAEILFCLALIITGMRRLEGNSGFGRLLTATGSCGLSVSFATAYFPMGILSKEGVVIALLAMGLVNIAFAAWRPDKVFLTIGFLGGLTAATLTAISDQPYTTLALNLLVTLSGMAVASFRRWPIWASLMGLASALATAPISLFLFWPGQPLGVYTAMAFHTWVVSVAGMAAFQVALRDSEPRDEILIPFWVGGLAGAVSLVFLSASQPTGFGVLNLVTMVAAVAALRYLPGWVVSKGSAGSVAAITLLGILPFSVHDPGITAFLGVGLVSLLVTGWGLAAIRGLAPQFAAEPYRPLGIAMVPALLGYSQRLYQSPTWPQESAFLVLCLVLIAPLVSVLSSRRPWTDGLATASVCLSLIPGARLVWLVALPWQERVPITVVFIGVTAVLTLILAAIAGARRWEGLAYVGLGVALWNFASLSAHPTTRYPAFLPLGDASIPTLSTSAETFCVFVVAIGLLATAALFPRNSPSVDLAKWLVIPSLWALFTRFMVILLGSGFLGLEPNASVSLAWTLFAAILITIGFASRDRAVRYGALAVFAATLLKIVTYDLAMLDPAVKVVVLMLAGGVMMLAGYAYIRLQPRLNGARPGSEAP